MKDRWEETLFHMAEQEQIIMPESLSDKIEEILCKPKNEKFHMNIRKSLILAAVLILLCSATAIASVGALKERMEAMNREKMEEYFTQIYVNKIGADNYNRPYYDAEKERMETLQEAYENEARFPKGELTMIEEAKEYKGRGVAFLGETSSFFFPDQEMSDEELLCIIDFKYKRDYSLQKMNEMIAAGEAQIPVIEEEEITPTDEETLMSDAVYEPTQELTIPYTGSLELDITIAAGRNELFLAGYNSVHRMAIGSSDSELFFDDFGMETRILAMCQAKNGDVYMALWQWPDENDAEKRTMSVWVVDKDGKLLRKIDLSSYIAPGRQGYARRMTIDDKGLLYLNTAGLKSLGEGQECGILVLDKEGNHVTTITSDEYAFRLSGGLGVGRDGKVYTYIENFYDPDNPQKTMMSIASLDVGKGTLDEIYYDIMPENAAIMIDIIAQGAESDFVFWGYDGIFTYNLGDECAVNVVPPYEAPCDWEGARSCALPDGRIVFADIGDCRIEEHPLGKRFHAVPEKTCFYYVPGM